MSESNGNTSDSTVVTTTRPPGKVSQILEKGASFIAPFLPEGVNIDRVYAEAQIAARENEKLADCDPWSLVKSVAQIQQWGLEIGTTAYLVPFYNRKKQMYICTPVAGYKGLIELMVGSGAVRAVDAQAVYEGEEFEYAYGLNPKLVHRPKWSAQQTGKIVAAYCIVILPFGAPPVFRVLPIEKIDATRRQYSLQWKDGPCPEWYAVKTAIRETSKYIPKNPRLAKALRAIEEDARAELGEEIGVVLPDEARKETPVQTAGSLGVGTQEQARTGGSDSWLTGESDEQIRADEQRMLEREPQQRGGR